MVVARPPPLVGCRSSLVAHLALSRSELLSLSLSQSRISLSSLTHTLSFLSLSPSLSLSLSILFCSVPYYYICLSPSYVKAPLAARLGIYRISSVFAHVTHSVPMVQCSWSAARAQGTAVVTAESTQRGHGESDWYRHAFNFPVAFSWNLTLSLVAGNAQVHTDSSLSLSLSLSLSHTHTHTHSLSLVLSLLPFLCFVLFCSVLDFICQSLVSMN